MAVKTCLMIGVSGMAGSWIGRMTECLGDRIQIVGLVDVNEEALAAQGAKLGLGADQLFTDYKEACAKVQADFCGIATPPQFHSPLAIAALEAGMPVICEKPIADTLAAAKAMAAKAEETGVAVRDYPELPLRAQQAGGGADSRGGATGAAAAHLRPLCLRLSRIQVVGQGVATRYWTFSLLFEGSVHHFDMMRFLAGGDCEVLQGFGWNPAWSSFKHYSSGFYLLRMDNGVHTAYEGNSSAAGITSCWHREYYRLEFEEGTVEIGAGDEVRIYRVGQEVEVYCGADDGVVRTRLFVQGVCGLAGGRQGVGDED